MAYVRTKRWGQRIYYYLVKSKREGGKVRQRVIRYLGKEPPTKEELENILREAKHGKDRQCTVRTKSNRG